MCLFRGGGSRIQETCLYNTCTLPKAKELPLPPSPPPTRRLVLSLGEGETENLDYCPKSFQAEYSRLKSCYHYKQIKCSSLLVRKSSSTKIVCNPTYRFIQIHVVSSSHIVRKMLRTNIPCESTSTGFINSPDIAQS